MGIWFVNPDNGGFIGFIETFAVRSPKRMAKLAEHSGGVADGPSITVLTFLGKQKPLPRFGREVTYGGLAG